MASRLVDFGLASVAPVAVVAIFVSRFSPQSRGFRGEEDNKEISEQTAFHEAHEKDHATTATTAKDDRYRKPSLTSLNHGCSLKHLPTHSPPAQRYYSMFAVSLYIKITAKFTITHHTTNTLLELIFH